MKQSSSFPSSTKASSVRPTTNKSHALPPPTSPATSNVRADYMNTSWTASQQRLNRPSSPSATSSVAPLSGMSISVSPSLGGRNTISLQSVLERNISSKCLLFPCGPSPYAPLDATSSVSRWSSFNSQQRNTLNWERQSSLGTHRSTQGGSKPSSPRTSLCTSTPIPSSSPITRVTLEKRPMKPPRKSSHPLPSYSTT